MKRLLTIFGISAIFLLLLCYKNNVDGKNQESYIGTWKVERVVEFTKISGIDDEEINEILKKELTYTENEIKFYNVSLKNPYYKKTIINNSDFFNEGYRNLKDIGINKDSVDEVEVFIKKTDNYAYYWNKFGGAFFIKDKDTLIVDYNGAYFELKRKK